MNEKTIKNVLAELDKTNVGVFEAVFSPYLGRFLSEIVQDIEKFQSEHRDSDCHRHIRCSLILSAGVLALSHIGKSRRTC